MRIKRTPKKRKDYTEAQLIRIYRRYARSLGWNDDKPSARIRVEMWRATGEGSLGPAIDYHEQRRGVWLLRRNHAIAAGVTCAVAIGVWWMHLL